MHDVSNVNDALDRLATEVYADGDSVVINVDYEYPIPLAGCCTAKDILSRVSHLCEKTWMTPDVIRGFIHVAARENGVNIEDS
ncbi:MAG: hypothetical protein IID37_06090 [Planctomycetes bacterium]|nr:hypothetical protein [Planctomycetota bacterium]